LFPASKAEVDTRDRRRPSNKTEMNKTEKRFKKNDVRLRRHQDMHLKMRAYDGLAFETTHSCIRSITQRSRGGGSYGEMPMRSLAKLSASDIESVVDS